MNILRGFRLMLMTAFLATTASAAYGQRTLTVFCRPGTQETQTAYLWDSIDESPRFPGGESELVRFINNERRYPAEAYRAGIEGRVRLSFIVDVDGSLHNIRVNRGPHESLNHEAVRIVREMPRWIPGTVDGIPVPTLYMLTIPFRL